MLQRLGARHGYESRCGGNTTEGRRRSRTHARAGCQPARNRDPGSASNRDPHRRLSSGSSAESTGRTRASRSERHESDAAMRGGYLWAPVGELRGGVWGGGQSGSVLEAPAVVAGLDDLAVVGERSRNRVTVNAAPKLTFHPDPLEGACQSSIPARPRRPRSLRGPASRRVRQPINSTDIAGRLFRQSQVGQCRTMKS